MDFQKSCYDSGMLITHSKKMDAFFDRCLSNMQKDTINPFLGKKVLTSNEHYMQKKMKKAGFQEFTDDESNWPSLFLSTKKWINSPYHKQIHLENITSNHFSYVKEPINANELFNVDVIQKDHDKELKDYMILRAMDEPCDAIYLLQDETDWMLDAPSEAITNDRPANKAHGNIITFGLGIGYFAYMASRNPNVTSITIVERSKEVIELFKTSILPQFDTTTPIEIIEGDAFDYFNEETLKQYDYCYVDIWQSNYDGLFLIEQLLEQYNPPIETCDFWIEDSCFNTLWTLIFVHFDELYHNRTNLVYEEYNLIMQKIRAYFAKDTNTYTDEEDLKFLMYDNQTIRNILSTKL